MSDGGTLSENEAANANSFLEHLLKDLDQHH
jgi:hypothetical protein